MRQEQLHSLPTLKKIRADLRNNLTPAEEELWRLLRKHQLQGLKFRRQHSIGNFIVDFYCAAQKLIIEVDGAVHDSPEAVANDKLRDETLHELGFKVLRIRNDEVFLGPDKVLNKIKDSL